MTLISYAQNFEDVMLWRALGSTLNGSYIDVGAAHPDEYSVTRAFYDRGWHGINIEPLPLYFHRLNAARPRDLNLNIGIAEKIGELAFFEIEGTGLSTLDRQVADKHRAAGWQVHEATIPVTTLSELCRKHVAGPIHFLKIDVEGAERAVLEGADFSLCRPWIIVVEATRPLSAEQNHDQWETLLLQAAYCFVWFDGLNRFYISAERWNDLSPAFATPPNVFDDFIRASDTEQLNRIIGSESRAARAEAQIAAAESRAARAEARVGEVEGRAGRAESNAARAGALAAEAESRANRAEANAARAGALTAEAEARARRLEMEAAHLKDQAAQTSAAHAVAMQEIETLRASTSWAITIPIRMLKLMLYGKPGLALKEAGIPLSRIERLGRVAGSGGSLPKRASRVMLYGLVRFVARAPAGRTMSRLVRATLPVPFRWVYTRYSIYRSIAASCMTMKSGPLDLADARSSYPPAVGRQEQNDLSMEEKKMLLRLRARKDVA